MIHSKIHGSELIPKSLSDGSRNPKARPNGYITNSQYETNNNIQYMMPTQGDATERGCNRPYEHAGGEDGGVPSEWNLNE